MRRWTALLLLAVGAAWAAPAADTKPDYPRVVAGAALRFPRDHGAHPDFRTEWWYFTGWLQGADGKPLGFQITFFRSRPAIDPANPSAFAPRQIVFAHAALSDPETREADPRPAHRAGRLRARGSGGARSRHRAARLAASAGRRRRLRARTPARDFALDLAFTPTQPIMVNGDRGYSRKGPRPEQASYYYSMPQLAASGTIVRGGKRVAVTGRAWLDREWSSTLLDPAAVGWDWAGINLDDGGALMAFQVRGRDGRALYAGGTLRRPGGSVIVLAPGDVRFVPRRRWRSPRTGAVYPVEAEFIVKLPEGAPLSAEAAVRRAGA